MLLISYRSTNSETPQLTIFYAGKMLVFDAFRPEKATEIMELATKLASENSSREENPTSAPITSEKLKDSKVPQPKTALETPRENQVIGSGKLINIFIYPYLSYILFFLA